MNSANGLNNFRLLLAALATTLFLAACGGGSSGGSPAAETPAPTTGTFGLFITDKQTDKFDQINVEVVKAVLIGGDNSQQVIFDEGSRVINLLDLTNFNEPIMFNNEVAVGTYTKLRLVIENLNLVPDSEFPEEAIPVPLPANGKIDLLDPDGFDVLPGTTVLAEVDIDVDKSIKVTGTGNSGKYKFRPVVKVQFTYEEGTLEKLTRVEGFVSDPLDPAGSFALCTTEAAENCVDVMTGIDTSFFNIEGAPTDFTGVELESPVVVFGRYEVDPDIVLNALVVEIGGAQEQVTGEVVSNPVDNRFLLLAENDSDLTVELQVGPNGTKFFDADGEIGADAIVLGAAVEVEGVADPADPDVIRAALVFVETDDDAQISGEIFDEPAADTRMFMLKPSEGNNISVHVMPDAVILFVDINESTVTIGDFDNLMMDQSVEIFGALDVESIFHANEIIVEGPPPSL